MTEAIEALAAAGQAADMMSAALAEARAATQPLTQARHRGWKACRTRTYGRARSHSHQASTPSPVRALTSMTSAAGLTFRRLPRNPSMSKSR